MSVRTKKAAQELALEVRAELDLEPHDPLDPYALAEVYGIPVVRLSEVVNLPASTVAHFATLTVARWSAALVPDGTARFILDNDHHPRRRRRVSIAHEMAHLLWEHEFVDILLADDGCLASDPGQEEEADRLSHELMVPSSAAHDVAKLGWTDLDVANHFGVSELYARMRMDRSGARRRAAHAVAKASRSDDTV